MAVRLYNEYIKVDPNFIPVFSRNSDRIYPDKWQSFYPHTSFKNILKDVVETLEKSNETKDRSIWMSGAYGTGKTYASFVIKHILEDSIDSITPYFIQNGMETLLARVKGVRAKGRILVVQRSASAGINTQDKLFNAIVESVRRAVSDAGLTYTGAESLSDKVLTILKHPETSAFNFQGAFNKYRGRFTEYSSVDSIIKDLEELDLEDKATNPGKINRPEKNPLDAKTTYHIGNRSFVVEPVFKKESPDTLGSVLLRLMKSESEKL